MANDKRMIVNVIPLPSLPPGQMLIVPTGAIQTWYQHLMNNFTLEIGPLEPEGDELRYQARFVPRVAQPGEPPKGGTDES